MPFQKRFNKEKLAQRSHKLSFDGERMGRLPPLDVIRDAVHESMVDLHTIFMTMQMKEGTLKPPLKFAVNVILIGLVYTNTFAGRPGEWETMTRKAAEDFVAGGGDVLEMPKHKTDYKYGTLGRHSMDSLGS